MIRSSRSEAANLICARFSRRHVGSRDAEPQFTTRNSVLPKTIQAVKLASFPLTAIAFHGDRQDKTGETREVQQGT